MTVKVLLVGEGDNELGKKPDWTSPVREPGVLEALARMLVAEGWSVASWLAWKDVRKYQAGRSSGADQRTVEIACLKAMEWGCQAVFIVRDSDGDTHRLSAMSAGIEAAAHKLNSPLRYAVGLAHQQLEAWVLACRGEPGSERMGQKKLDERLRHHSAQLDPLRSCGLNDKSTSVLVMLVKNSRLDELPADATHLRHWLQQVRAALSS
jgi:hypothetical protein